MQKKKQTKPIKKIIILTILAILLLLLIFAEDIIKLTNKNKINLAENTPNETTIVEPNTPVLSAGMIPIKWGNDHFVITTQNDTKWYDYKNGKPAYIMLNDGYYQSELLRDMTNKELAENNVGVGVPDDPQTQGTILMWIPRFAINDDTNQIKYIKNVEPADENWTIPEMFTYTQEDETKPDFLLTGIWFEINVDNNYSNKITQMNSENSIYGFIKNTIALSSNQTTQNEIQQYIENTVGAPLVGIPEGSDTAVPLIIPDITNPNRIILKIINQNNQAPIKAKASYNKDTGLIQIDVTYSQYGIQKILLENEYELKFENINEIVTATSEGIDIEDGEKTIKIIDKKGNRKQIKVEVINKIYVVLYTDGTLAFGKAKNPIPNKVIKQNYGDITNMVYEYKTEPWYSKSEEITTIEFVNKISPISTAWWFFRCTNLTTINNIDKLDTSNVTTMRAMFRGCTRLTKLDLSSFDTSNVTIMWQMFFDCNSLEVLDLSSFDISNVTHIGQMFLNCTNLTNLDLSNFDTSNVEDMHSLFAECKSLTKLNLGKFNTSKVTDMSNMFNGCSALTSLDLSNFNTSKVTDMVYMFANCNGLTSLDVSNFDTSKVTNMQSMFYECSRLTNLNLSSFDTSSVTNMYSMFGGCNSLTSIDISNFNTSNVTRMESMFNSCDNLTSLDLSNFDTSNVTNMNYMFYNCSNLKTIYVGANWKLANNRVDMFYRCGINEVTRK